MNDQVSGYTENGKAGKQRLADELKDALEQGSGSRVSPEGAKENHEAGDQSCKLSGESMMQALLRRLKQRWIGIALVLTILLLHLHRSLTQQPRGNVWGYVVPYLLVCIFILAFESPTEW